MKRNLHFLVILMCAALLIGCDSIQSQINELELQRASSQQRLDAAARKIAALQNQSNELTRKIQTRKSETLAYIQKHFVAVACMAAVGYSTGEDNVFSKDVNDAINTGSLLCAFGVALSEDFRREVIGVVAELEEADVEIKGFMSQINSFKSQIIEETGELKSEKAVYNRLSEQISSLQAKSSRKIL